MRKIKFIQDYKEKRANPTEYKKGQRVTLNKASAAHFVNSDRAVYDDEKKGASKAKAKKPKEDSKPVASEVDGEGGQDDQSREGVQGDNDQVMHRDDDEHPDNPRRGRAPQNVNSQRVNRR